MTNVLKTIIQVALYLRVSSEEQTRGFSLEAQERLCRDFARGRGWEIVAVFIDPGFSAKTDKRPQFRRMIAEAQAGAFDVILVHKLDRFARNRKDAVTYKALLKQAGVMVYSASEPIDPADPSALITEGMLEVVAEWYSANLARETAKGKLARAEAGYQNNAAPFGYRKAKGKDAIAEIDPDTVDGYRLAIRRALEGGTDMRIAWDLNEAGYRTTAGRLFSKDTVAAMLRSRYYLGEVHYRGQWYAGRHPAAIERATWEQMQAMRAGRVCRPDKINVTARPFPLTPVLYCAECGAGMRGNPGPGGRRYYRDTGKEHGLKCSQTAAPAEDLESQVGEFIAGLQIPEDWRAIVLTQLGQDAGEVEKIEQQRRRLEAELARAKKLYIAGDLSESEYNHERGRIHASLKNLVVPALPDLTKAAALLADFGRVWRLANDHERKQIVCALLARVWVKDKSVVGIEPKAEAYYLLVAACQASPRRVRFRQILLIRPGAQLKALFSQTQGAYEENLA